ncbi:DNA replication licensing factor MCM7 [Mycoemilia scoparia]|uniref:DNA replication licensing factor MCM7 n=1 Tax=Mycoemilia scoparia TaxID=417184 RepID=A0A9W7ZKE0_9FUNG|nr:DNA replication licensing factor MCM7 [Mycoemilia scoparia]
MSTARAAIHQRIELLWWQTISPAKLTRYYSVTVNTEQIEGFIQKFEQKGGSKEILDDGQTIAMRGATSKYLNILQKVADRTADTITIDLDDLAIYEQRQLGETDVNALTFGNSLVRRIENNAKRYIELFSRAVDRLMPESQRDDSMYVENDDVMDVIIEQRRLRDRADREREEREGGMEGVETEGVSMEQGAAGASKTQAPNGSSATDEFPAILTRRYSLYFKPMNAQKAQSVRMVGADQIGHLVTIRGIVTRVTEVRPCMAVAAYLCDTCGCEIFQEIKARQFTPLSQCESNQCKVNRSRGKLHRQTRGSKFLRFQEVKIQEMTDQVPMGDIPRTLTIHCYESTTRQVNPGDVVHMSGIFLPAPYTGFRAMRAGLLADTYMEVQHVNPLKRQYEKLATQITPEVEAQLSELSQSEDVYTRMANAIAPEIYGHEDVKKALLLLLIGAPHQKTADGMSIRGDINICLMGDPGVAKSQLLRYICKVAPRGVYTTGRGSSGVGLTASVMRDPVTGEMVLEGGALVLADRGICCIDEFDKMDESDRTAIHEVMEQQTISVAKAGITTTLNARTSILAAANPARSRYNPRLTPEENINLPAALLSRFDVLFLILDRPSHDDDLRLARHVAFVHMHGRHPTQNDQIDTSGDSGQQSSQSDSGDIGQDLLRRFVARARQHDPMVPRDVADYIVGAYVEMRQAYKATMEREQARKQRRTTDATDAASQASTVGNITPRTLLGIIRLAQAHARVCGSDQVRREDIDEALRLIEAAQVTLDTAMSEHAASSRRRLGGGHPRGANADPTSAIFEILVRTARQNSGGGQVEPMQDIKYAQVLERVRNAGYNESQLSQCLRQYEEINILQVNLTRTKITFVAAPGV